MQGTITKKIPGGKLLRLDVTYDKQIEKVVITGDFFIHPEETLTDLEDCLVNIPLSFDGKMLTSQLEDMISRRKAELVGFCPVDLVSLLKEAII